MELREVLRRRRMVRRFDSRTVPEDVLARVLDAARRAPSAGFSQGVDLIVLSGPDETSRYWDAALPVAERDDFPWPGLMAAPVLILPCARPALYLERYSQPDKAAAGLGEDRAAWPVPFWTVDTAFATENLLLAAVDEQLGALFFGLFEQEPIVRLTFGIPDDVEPIGTIALGYAAADDRPSGSARRRRRRSGDEMVHRGGW